MTLQDLTPGIRKGKWQRIKEHNWIRRSVQNGEILFKYNFK